MYEKLEGSGGKVLGYRVTGRLTREQYEAIARELRDAISRWGKIRLLVSLEGFSGIDPSAIWEDIKFTVEHARDIERMAVVGDRAWERWFVEIGDKLVKTEARFFESPGLTEAWDWLRENPDV